jgi:HK97 family phage portal protein
MKLRLPFGREITIGKRLFGIGRDDAYFGMIGTGGSQASDLDLLNSYQGFVYACINLIAQTAASSYEPIIYQTKGDSQSALKTHPLLDLLARPGGRDDKAINISKYDLIYATVAFQLLQGDSYWYMAKGVTSGLPREITILRADKVGKELDENGDIARFFVRTVGGSKVYIEIDEMVPMIGFDPLDPYRGKGVTEAAQDLIATDEFTTKFTKNFFKNNAGVNGVMTLKGEVAKTAFEKFTRAWRSKYEGVDHAGKMAILRDTDAEFVKVGLGLNELDMSALRGMTKQDVAEMFGVPMALLGKGEQTGLGRANIEAFEYIFAKYTIEPKLKKLDDTLEFMLSRYYNGDTLSVEHEDIIPDDEVQELAERVAAVDRWQTRNEIRDEEGMDPIEGGDQLFVPINNIPVNESSMAAPPSQAANNLVLRRKIVVSKKKDQTTSLNPEQKEAFRLRVMRNQGQYERKYLRTLKPIIVEQRKEALNNLEAHGSSLTKAFDQKLFDDAASDSQMQQALKPVLIQLGKDQGALAMVFAGDTEDEFRMTAAYEKFLNDRTAKAVGNFNDETLAALNKTLSEGIAQGEPISELTKRVKSVYDGIDNYRAKRIARTETLSASNTATNEAYKQTGYVTGKEWVVNPDACEQCLEFEGKTIGLDETYLALGESYSVGENTFTNDYIDIDSPPLHPNCRCTIIPIR